MRTRYGTAGVGAGGVLSGVDEDGLSRMKVTSNSWTAKTVQVYELVAVDVNGDPTNVLEQAAASAKDNRLFAVGFSSSHPSYDTTRVEGEALIDVDYTFNSELGLDRLTYLMNAEPMTGNVNIDVRVWYQSMPARWIESMFDVQDSTIQAFQILFNAQGAAPELVAETSVSIPVVASTNQDVSSSNIQAVPNPTLDGFVRVQVPNAAVGSAWELFAPQGALVNQGTV